MSSHPPPPPKPALPLHGAVFDANGRPLRVRRREGKPKLAATAPDANELAYIRQLNHEREEHVLEDGLVTTLAKGAPAEQVLHEIVKGLARESACFSFEIRQAKDGGSPIEQILSRRIDGLHKIALVLLGMRRFGIDRPLDPRSARMRRIAELWIVTISEVAAATLPSETTETFVASVKAAMTAWAEDGAGG